MAISHGGSAKAEPDDPDLIEVYAEIGGEKEVMNEEYPDPFDHVDISKQDRKVKTRFARLKKKFEGTDGAEAKYNEMIDVDGYGMYGVVQPPYNMEALAGLLDMSAIHQAAIHARAMNTVGLGYKWEKTAKSIKKVERASSDPERAKRVRDILTKEELRLEEAFEELNDEDTIVEALTKAWTDTLAMGNGYLEIGRTRSGEIGYLGHVPGAAVRIRRQRDGYIQLTGNKAVFFRNFQDTETKNPVGGDANPNEIIHLKMYSPSNNWYGIPPAVSAMSAIVGDKFAKDYNIDYFENKAIPRYALIIKGGKLSNKSKSDIVNYFKNEVKGKNHGTLVIPIPSTMGKDVDVKFEKLEAGIQDQSFDKYRKSNRDEIVIAHRVPAPKVGIYDNANLAVSRDADKTFKVQVIGPDQQGIEKRINRIVKEFSDLLRFKFAEIDIIDEDLRSRIHDRYLRTEAITPNEVREDIGRSPIEGGDEVLPYPAKVKKEQDAKRGAPDGNSNAQSGSPSNSRQDSGSAESTSEVTTGTNRERGEAQETGQGGKQ